MQFVGCLCCDRNFRLIFNWMEGTRYLYDWWTWLVVRQIVLCTVKENKIAMKRGKLSELRNLESIFFFVPMRAGGRAGASSRTWVGRPLSVSTLVLLNSWLCFPGNEPHFRPSVRRGCSILTTRTTYSTFPASKATFGFVWTIVSYDGRGHVDLRFRLAFSLLLLAHFENYLLPIARENSVLDADTREFKANGHHKPPERGTTLPHCRWNTGCWPCNSKSLRRQIDVSYRRRLLPTFWASHHWCSGVRTDYVSCIAVIRLLLV